MKKVAKQKVTTERTKATFYLDEEHLKMLEEERHRRRMAGWRGRGDISILVREAIELAYGKKKRSER